MAFDGEFYSGINEEQFRLCVFNLQRAAREPRLPPLQSAFVEGPEPLIPEKVLRRRNSFPGFISYKVQSISTSEVNDLAKQHRDILRKCCAGKVLTSEIAEKPGTHLLAAEHLAKQHCDTLRDTSKTSHPAQLNALPTLLGRSVQLKSNGDEIKPRWEPSTADKTQVHEKRQHALAPQPPTQKKANAAVPPRVEVLPTAPTPAETPVKARIPERSMIARGFVVEVLKTVDMVEATLADDDFQQRKETCFDMVGRPLLDLPEYLDRISTYTKCSDEALVIAMIYLDRLAISDSDVALSKKVCYRLFLTSICVAYKYHDGYDDDSWPESLEYWSRVGGYTSKQIQSMEREFVRMLGWRLYVSPEEYDGYYSHLCRGGKGDHRE